MLIRSYIHSLPSLLAGTATVAAIVISLPTAANAKTAQEIAQIAISRTVQINTPLLPGGSGVLIGKQGNTYVVLTANHVVKRPDLPYTVRTNIGKEYPVRVQQLQSALNSPDLAIVTFESSDNYSMATVGDSDQAVIGSEIYVAGYPAGEGLSGKERDLEFTQGIVTSRPQNRPQGYNLRYNAVTRGGMSGGPVLDSNGRVIGIHGQGDIEGSFQSESGGSIVAKTGFNSAIPINTFLALKSQVGLGSSKVVQERTPTDTKPAQVDAPKTAKDYYARGLTRYDQGDRQGAAKAFNQALQLNPNDARAFSRRGDLRYDKGEAQGAIEDYTQAIRLDPNLANAYYNRGVARYQAGDKQGALDDMNQVLRLTPGDATAYQNRATINRRLNNRQQALEDLDQVVRLTPSSSRAYYNRAVARLDLNDRQGTVEDFNQALSLDPTFVLAYISRAQVRRRLGDREGAIEDLSQALSLKSDDAVAYYTRGLYRRDLGDLGGALEDLQKAAGLFQQQNAIPNYQKAIEKVAEVQQRLQQPSRAPSSAPALESNSTSGDVEESF